MAWEFRVFYKLQTKEEEQSFLRNLKRAFLRINDSKKSERERTDIYFGNNPEIGIKKRNGDDNMIEKKTSLKVDTKSGAEFIIKEIVNSIGNGVGNEFAVTKKRWKTEGDDEVTLLSFGGDERWLTVCSERAKLSELRDVKTFLIDNLKIPEDKIVVASYPRWISMMQWSSLL